MRIPNIIDANSKGSIISFSSCKNVLNLILLRRGGAVLEYNERYRKQTIEMRCVLLLSVTPSIQIGPY